MASGHFAVVYREIGRLFQSGTVAGMSEGQLLDRFVARRDGDAFEAIVARHGSMVLAVCRDHLRDPNDVDDAFQATFLVLVRRAGSLRRRDLLGNWLYGVARRVAKRAQVASARRRDREGIGPEPVGASPSDFDLRPMIHDEVNRLPDSYRAAVVLCFFEGRTHEEAADRLGWPVGTVKGRLARAKDLLRDRLTRRGVTLPAGLLAVTLARSSEAAIPPGLLASTLSSASAVSGSAFVTSPAVIALTQGVLQTMIVTKLKVATSLIVAVGVLSGTGVLAYQAGGGFGPAQAAPGRQASAKPDPKQVELAESQVVVAEQALAYYQKLRERGQLPATSPQILTWARRLYEAKVDAWVPKADAAKPYIEALTAAEAAARKLQDSGQGTMLEVLEIKYQRLQAEAALKSPAPPAAGMMSAMMGMGAGGAAEGGGRIGAGGGGADNRPRRPRTENPADLERNKAINSQLDQSLSMSFDVNSALEDVLKYIRTNTTSEALKLPNGIPIYVDPNGLKDADQTMTSTVNINLDGIPLRTTLRLMLRQLHLDYRVRDGLVYISDRDYIDDENADAENESLQKALRAGPPQNQAESRSGSVAPGSRSGSAASRQ